MGQEVLEIILAFIKAFVVGGAICVIAQIVINFTDLTAGKILVYFMLAGVVLTAIGLYQPLVDFAGAGATVPISGFGYLLANGAIKGAEKGFFYAVTGSLAAASAGVSAAVADCGASVISRGSYISSGAHDSVLQIALRTGGVGKHTSLTNLLIKAVSTRGSTRRTLSATSFCMTPRFNMSPLYFDIMHLPPPYRSAFRFPPRMPPQSARRDIDVT